MEANATWRSPVRSVAVIVTEYQHSLINRSLVHYIVESFEAAKIGPLATPFGGCLRVDSGE